MRSDIENDAVGVNYVSGYPSLAAFIASDPDHSTAIYRRFDRLSARNLLYLQSELVALEKQQDELDKQDLISDELDGKAKARNWDLLVERAESGNDDEALKRVTVAKAIREKIKEYREAIVLESAILSMRRPSKQTHKAFYNEFHNVEDGKETFPTLGGTSASVYDDRNDIMALSRPSEEDRLTMFLRKHCSILFTTRRPRGTSSLAYISQYRISIVVGAINILLAAAFLFGAIYNLYYVQRDHTKLGLIAGYTVAFAMAIGLVTKATRSEIFGSCAAYAAVLVVFVSGNLGNNGGSRKVGT